METGTAEPIKIKKKKLKRKPDLRYSNGLGGDNGDQNNGGGGNGGDDGDNFPSKVNSDQENPVPLNKSRILMIFLLVVVVMTFGGLISAYVVLATNNALEWQPFSLPFQVWISTVLIIAGSFTYHRAKKFLIAHKSKLSKKWFIITTFLGAAFISSQLLAWVELVDRGLYMSGNPFAGFFYILTAVHGIHVLGGISALGYIILRAWNQTFSDEETVKRINDATAIGWYWHTMGGLWLILLFLLGFWN